LPLTERRVPELIPVLGSQPAGDVSHKPGGRLSLLYARPTVTPQPLRGLLPILLLGEQRQMDVNSLPKTVTRQRRGCDLNPGPSAPESSTLITRLPSLPQWDYGRGQVEGETLTTIITCNKYRPTLSQCCHSLAKISVRLCKNWWLQQSVRKKQECRSTGKVYTQCAHLTGDVYVYE